jgi:DNA (cytosine-5)-methyltransferase 1
LKKNKTIRVVDLFSGCGGMSLGFQSAGFEIAAAYDNWQPAIDIYKKNFQHPIYQMDLSDLSVVDQLMQHKADVIVGGPPCQDFSIAGKRNFKGSRADLTYKFSEIIAEVRPKWFVMENVYNIEKSPVLNDVLNCFKSAGYGLTAGVYEASRMNVPQNRKRYFLIGKLDESDDFLKSSIEQSMAKNRMTVREYLGDMLQTDYYYMHPRSYNRRAIFSVDEPSATIRGVNRPIPSSYVPHAADKTINKDLVRALTTKERSYLQTFPPEYQLHGSKSNLEQLIGNAVPVKMAEFIALRILENF